MRANKLRCLATILASCLVLLGELLCGAVVGLPQAKGLEGGAPPSGTGASDKGNTKVKALLKERLETLRTLAHQIGEAYKANDGAVSFKHVYDANLMVLNAELELCDSQTDRIAILEKIFSAAKDYEAHIREGVQSGGVASSALVKAKIARLDAEIALERAKANAAARPK